MAARSYLVGGVFSLSDAKAHAGQSKTFVFSLINAKGIRNGTVSVNIAFPTVIDSLKTIKDTVRAAFKAASPNFEVITKCYSNERMRFVIYSNVESYVFMWYTDDSDTEIGSFNEGAPFIGLTKTCTYSMFNAINKNTSGLIDIPASVFAGAPLTDIAGGGIDNAYVYFKGISTYVNTEDKAVYIGYSGYYPAYAQAGNNLQGGHMNITYMNNNNKLSVKGWEGTFDSRRFIKSINGETINYGFICKYSLTNGSTLYSPYVGAPLAYDKKTLVAYNSTLAGFTSIKNTLGFYDETSLYVPTINEGDTSFPITDDEPIVEAPSVPKSTYSYVLSGSFVQEDDLAAVRALGSATLIFSEKNTGDSAYTSKTYTIKFPSTVIRNQIKAYIQHALGSKYKVLHKKVLNNSGTDSGWIKWIIVGSEPTFKFTLTGGTACAALKFNADGYGFHVTNRDNETNAPARLYSQTGIPSTGTNIIAGNVRNGAGVTKSFTKAVPANSTPTTIAALLNQDLGTDAKCYASNNTVFLQDGAYRSPGQSLSVTGSVPNAAGFAFPLSIPSYPAMESSADGDFPVKSDVLPNETVVFTEVTSATLRDYGSNTYLTKGVISFSVSIAANSPIHQSIFQVQTGTGQLIVASRALVENGKVVIYFASQSLDASIKGPYALVYNPNANFYINDVNGDKVEAFSYAATVIPAAVTQNNGTLIVFSLGNFTGQQDSLRITIGDAIYDSPLLNFNKNFSTVDAFLTELKAAWPTLFDVCDVFDASYMFSFTAATSLIFGLRSKDGRKISPFVSLHNGGTYSQIMRLAYQIIVDSEYSQAYSYAFVPDSLPISTTANSVTFFAYKRDTSNPFAITAANFTLRPTFTATDSLDTIVSKFNAALGANSAVLQFEKRITDTGMACIVGVTQDKSLSTCALGSNVTVGMTGFPYSSFTQLTAGGLYPTDFSDINYPLLEKAEFITNETTSIKLYYDRLLTATNSGVSRSIFNLTNTSGQVVAIAQNFTIQTADNKSIVVLTTSVPYIEESIFLTLKCNGAYAIMAQAAPYYVLAPLYNIEILKQEEPPALQSASINAQTVTLLYDKELSTTLTPKAENFVIDVTQ